LKLANKLRTASSDVIRKGEYQQQRKELDKIYSDLSWGPPSAKLLQISWEDFRLAFKEGSQLIAIDGLIYDIEAFIDQHPGGKAIVSAYLGKDATNAFNGGLYLRKLF
jgi:stearoyl-CoA desaturase (delta-9 desaturase)